MILMQLGFLCAIGLCCVCIEFAHFIKQNMIIVRLVSLCVIGICCWYNAIYLIHNNFWLNFCVTMLGQTCLQPIGYMAFFYNLGIRPWLCSVVFLCLSIGVLGVQIETWFHIESWCLVVYFVLLYNYLLILWIKCIYNLSIELKTITLIFIMIASNYTFFFISKSLYPTWWNQNCQMSNHTINLKIVLFSSALTVCFCLWKVDKQFLKSQIKAFIT